MNVEGMLEVREAAQLLGVSQGRVQALARDGQIVSPARGLYDAWSVRAFQSRRQGMHTQGWASRTAWAAVAVLSDEPVTWIGQPQQSRVTSRLRRMSVTDLVAASRNRALIGRFTAHSAALSRMAADTRMVACTPLPELVNVGEPVEWYLTREAESGVVGDYGLRRSTSGQVLLRSADTRAEHGRDPIDLNTIERLMAGGVLPALDACTSDDPRVAGLGRRKLGEVLTRFQQT